MVYAMIYVGAFCIRFTTPNSSAPTTAGTVVGDMIAAFGWGTIGSAAVLVVRGLGAA